MRTRWIAVRVPPERPTGRVQSGPDARGVDGLLAASDVPAHRDSIGYYDLCRSRPGHPATRAARTIRRAPAPKNRTDRESPRESIESR